MPESWELSTVVGGYPVLSQYGHAVVARHPIVSRLTGAVHPLLLLMLQAFMNYFNICAGFRLEGHSCACPPVLPSVRRHPVRSENTAP
jgi:hypothetical protein